MLPLWSVMRPLCLLCLLSAGSLSFVLRKRPWEEPASLNDALNIIKQERKRLQDAERFNPEMEPGRDFIFDEGIEEEPIDTDEVLRKLLLSADEEEGGYPLEEEQILEEEQRLESEPSFQDISADKQELEDILQPSEEEEKRSIPYALGGPSFANGRPKKEYDPSMDKKEAESLSNQDVQTLLDEAEAEEVQAMQDEDAEEEAGNAAREEEEDDISEDREGEGDNQEEEEGDRSTVVPVSEEELQDMLDDEGLSGGLAQEINLYPNKNNNWPQYPAKEVALNKELLNEYLQEEDTLPSRKRKRSGAPPGVSEAESAREYIKHFLELEDDENTNLANALNLATLAQVERTDKYTVSEADFIKKAISDEEAIQNLKSTLKEDGEEEDELMEEDIGFGKRMDTEELENEEDDDEEDVDRLEEALQAKLRSFLMRTAMENEENEAAYDEDGRWFNSPVEIDQEGMDQEDLHLNPFIRELMEKYKTGLITKRGGFPYEDNYEENTAELLPYGEEEEEDDELNNNEVDSEIENTLAAYISQLEPWQQDELREEVDEKLEELTQSEDICPALSLVDGCFAANEMGLRLDDDALDLCNRHQLCYMCGAEHGLSEVHCDGGYMQDAARLCSMEANPEKCQRDATKFFDDVLTTEHEFKSARSAPYQCRDTCAYEYIQGLKNK